MPAETTAAVAQRRQDSSGARPTIGVLLAGGRARRMGGGGKALKMLGGMTLLGRVLEILKPQCDGLLINANDPASLFAEFGLPIVPDDLPDFPGPLAGVLAGLDYVAAHHPQAEFAVTAPVDTPFLPADLVGQLQEARSQKGSELASTRSGGRVHPIVTLWPIGLRTELRRAMVDEDLRKVEHFLARHERAYADWPAAPFDPFFNINTPEDLAEAEALLAKLARVAEATR